jgi:hypothetical protein
MTSVKNYRRSRLEESMELTEAKLGEIVESSLVCWNLLGRLRLPFLIKRHGW